MNLAPATDSRDRRRIRELETELAIIRDAAKFLGEDVSGPKGGSTW
ncbi:hypothetical protein BJY24_005676 [Nocardia transvalensis]|uniref:Uncharacterized protein n=1 Tax=Nocardia transvalensis TaxID=37333 RepID=A0A7W9PIF7_9NOCA|nr:hypothetical protein [Nocardia transvalensis]MBB5916764.1 hypothetical protein [Nocardia transvalensis]